MLLSLHPNIIVHVENIVSLFSSSSTSSQKVRKCGGHHCLTEISTIASLELPKFAEMLLENDVAFITPYTIVHVENVVSLFSSPSTSSQKVRKCGGHHCLTEISTIASLELPKFAEMLLENDVAFITP